MTLRDMFREWRARPGQIYCDRSGELLLIIDPRLADRWFFLAMVGVDGVEEIIELDKKIEYANSLFFIGVLDEHYQRPWH